MLGVGGEGERGRGVPGRASRGQPMASWMVRMVLQSRWLMRKLPPLKVPMSSVTAVTPENSPAGGAPARRLAAGSWSSDFSAG